MFSFIFFKNLLYVAYFGDGCFAATGPRLWNSLSAGLRQTDMDGYEQFKWLLKTFLWALRSRRMMSICLNCAWRNFLTYSYHCTNFIIN